MIASEIVIGRSEEGSSVAVRPPMTYEDLTAVNDAVVDLGVPRAHRWEYRYDANESPYHVAIFLETSRPKYGDPATRAQKAAKGLTTVLTKSRRSEPYLWPEIVTVKDPLDSPFPTAPAENQQQSA
jgi:hypothetical protein